MINEVNKIISLSASEILKSENSNLLLHVYRTLYLNGGSPRTCASAKQKYYKQILKTGLMKATIVEEIKNRTCVPNWNGRKYLKGKTILVDSDTIRDSQALILLDKGILTKSDFKTMPKKATAKKEAAKKEEKKA